MPHGWLRSVVQTNKPLALSKGGEKMTKTIPTTTEIHWVTTECWRFKEVLFRCLPTRDILCQGVPASLVVVLGTKRPKGARNPATSTSVTTGEFCGTTQWRSPCSKQSMNSGTFRLSNCASGQERLIWLRTWILLALNHFVASGEEN